MKEFIKSAPVRVTRSAVVKKPASKDRKAVSKPKRASIPVKAPAKNDKKSIEKQKKELKRSAQKVILKKVPAVAKKRTPTPTKARVALHKPTSRSTSRRAPLKP